MQREGFSLLLFLVKFFVKWRRSPLGGRRALESPPPCILDRIDYGFVFDIAATQRGQKFHNKFSKWSVACPRLRAGLVSIHSRPVSYTHLDVYKRQVPSRPVEAGDQT